MISTKKLLYKVVQQIGLISDYVVEQGTSGIWTYRKWNSGIAECWGNYSGSVTLSTVGVYYHRGLFSSIAYPTSLFNSAPIVNVTNQTSTYWCAVESNSSTEITRIHVYDIVNGTGTVKVGLHVIGKWK